MPIKARQPANDPLFFATENGNAKVVKALIDKGATIGLMHLKNAAKNGNPETFNILGKKYVALMRQQNNNLKDEFSPPI